MYIDVIIAPENVHLQSCKAKADDVHVVTRSMVRILHNYNADNHRMLNSFVMR